MEDPLLVVLAPDHPALADAVALTAVRAERWVATPPGTACRAMLDDACRAAGFVPDVPFHANDFAVLAAYAAEGLAVALIPALAAGGFGPEVAVRPVAGAAVRRRIYVAARRGTLANPAVGRWPTRSGRRRSPQRDGERRGGRRARRASSSSRAPAAVRAGS